MKSVGLVSLLQLVVSYKRLCYWSNFSKLLLAGWFEIRPGLYLFHSNKRPMILKNLVEI